MSYSGKVHFSGLLKRVKGERHSRDEDWERENPRFKVLIGPGRSRPWCPKTDTISPSAPTPLSHLMIYCLNIDVALLHFLFIADGFSQDNLEKKLLGN